MDKSKVIREAIESRQSLRSFAKDAGINYNTLISALSKENGIYGMSLANGKKICKALGITLDELLDSETQILDSDELELIERYRKASYDGKKLISITARYVTKLETGPKRR